MRHEEWIGEGGETVRECGLYPELPTWWFLPLAGALCGYATNWIAMWLIFKPIEPTTYLGCITLHGSFLKRQSQACTYHGYTCYGVPTVPRRSTNCVHSPCHVLAMHSPCTHHALTMHSPCAHLLHTYLWQVSEEFATISAARLLTAQNCWERILFGPRSHHLEKIVARQVKRQPYSYLPWRDDPLAMVTLDNTYHGPTYHACTFHGSTSSDYPTVAGEAGHRRAGWPLPRSSTDGGGCRDLPRRQGAERRAGLQRAASHGAAHVHLHHRGDERGAAAEGAAAGK